MAYRRSFMFLGVILFVILSTQVLDANHVPEPSITKSMVNVESRLMFSESDLMAIRDGYKEKHAVQVKIEELDQKFDELLVKVKALNEEILDLNERLKSSVEASVSVDEKIADHAEEYKNFSRAALIAKIFESESLQLEVAKSSFDNVVTHILVVNPNMELVAKGLDEFKEVRDEQIVSPPPKD